MPLTAGTRLGPYEIGEAIGAGGMGEVYAATDTRLDRRVAIKILPPHWADDADMKERFDREAQAIASLNHPNICALHDVGTEKPDAETDPVSFLVMEYLEGETLAARLERGPLTLDEALDVALPIVDALDQAHRRGVVHRDLKPGNVMITPGGPKLLDFGLARTPAGVQAGTGSGETATLGPVPTTPLTTPGLIIGTLQYMAPEQLEGLEADARTDIFAFGTMLHEMVTGKRAFEGATQVLLISSIATSDPEPLSAVQPASPAALDHVVRTCLAKNPDDRWQTARDLLAELRWIADGGAAASAIVPLAKAPARRLTRLRYGLVAAAVVGVVLAVPAYSYLQGSEDSAETRYRLWSRPFRDQPHQNGFFAISPDGRNLAFRGDLVGPVDPFGLYVGRVGEVAYRRLADTDEPTQPFWSPDSLHIAFIADGRLQRIEASGGPPQVIAAVPSFLGGAWNSDGTIIFGSSAGIYSVSAEGGTPELVTSLEEQETGHYWPHFLPDERRFLYLAWSADAGSRAVFTGSLDGGDRVKVLDAASNVEYTTAGHLLFSREGAVYAQPFDTGDLALWGEPTRVADEVSFSASNGRALFASSRDGTLVYSQRDDTAGLTGGAETWLWQPAWVDRSGQEIAKVGPYDIYRGLEVSPDGTRVALHRHDDTGGDVWIAEPTGSDTRITYEPAYDNSMPIWSPDGRFVAFNAQRDGKWGLYRSLSDRGSAEELLYESDWLVVPMSWSPDGQHIVFGVVDPETSGDLWVLTLESADGAVSGEPTPIVATPANETHGQISPDGRWLAYASNQTDASQYEVYVRPFPEGVGRWQVSPTGGDWPRWSRDGQELFFLENVPEGVASGGVLSAVTVGARDETFVAEPPEPTMQFRIVNLAHPGGDYPTYAVGPDGNFLIFIRVFDNVAPTTAPDVVTPDLDGGLTIARHWEAALIANR